MTIDIDALRKHVGTKIVEEDVATLAPLKGLIVTFDRDEQPPKQGEPIPPGWHLVYFVPTSRKATLGADGLPTTGSLPPSRIAPLSTNGPPSPFLQKPMSSSWQSTM
jgi:3-methylfumaryl-CoA hydratase